MTLLPTASATLILLAALGAPAFAETVAAAPVTPVAAAPVAGAPDLAPAKPAAEAPRTAAPANETQRYCQNIAAAAADARFAWQRKQITDLEAQLKQRVADLGAREAALREAIAHRDEVMKRATDTVVAIYAKMKPDAAAAQIGALDDEMASAVLSQLTTKQASLILNEIPTDRAAKLMALVATPLSPGKKS